jgi:VanZ family protein
MVSFLKKYFGALYIPVIWMLLVAVLCFLPGSMIPNESGFKIPQFDKFVHICMFGGFVFTWNLYLSNRISDLQKLMRYFFLVYLLGCAYGIGSEFVQKYWIPGRDYDNVDIISDIMGAGVAYGLSHLLLVARRGPAVGAKNKPL